MTQQFLDGAIPIFGNFPEGFNGWGPDMNRNLLLMSYFVQPSVINTSQRTPPSTLVAGRMYIARSGNTFTSSFYFPDEIEFANQRGIQPAIPANSIVLRQLGGWWYIPPKLGMQVYNQSTSSYYTYNGSAWVPVIPLFIGGRWYKTSTQLVGTSSTIVWHVSEFQTGMSRSGNILNIPTAGYYDIRLQTTSNRGNGSGTTTIAIRNAGSNKTLATAGSYSPTGIPITEINNCSWQGYLGSNSQIDFRISTTEGPTTIYSGDSSTFFDCKKIG